MKKYGANLNISGSKDELNVFYKVLEAGENVKDEKTIFLKTSDGLIPKLLLKHRLKWEEPVNLASIAT